VANAVAAIEQELFEADWADARNRLGDAAVEADLRRTAAQRRADALVEMAIRAMTAPADGKRPAPLFTVLCGLARFAQIVETAAGTVITPGEAAEYVDGADIERVVFESPSRVIDLGKRTRFFVGALRRVIEIRDRRCQGPGCRTPADQCHIDHRNEYAFGGLTCQENGECQCPWHNRRKEQRRRQTKPPPNTTAA
jgi:hypothetical protein